MARKIIKGAKKKTWREYCSSIGSEIKCLVDVYEDDGKRTDGRIPALVRGSVVNKDKADLLGETFAALHNGKHQR